MYGKLTVLYRSVNCTKDKKAKWICQCECGNICEATGKEMRASKIVSCGCSKIERLKTLHAVDLIGQKYGKLTVIRKTNERTATGKVIWECRCDCGNTKFTNTSSLQTGKTKSCGCLNSYGEYLIKQVLNDLGILYKEQYTFAELYTITNRKNYLRFDFGVVNNEGNLQFLIEFDGEQKSIL